MSKRVDLYLTSLVLTGNNIYACVICVCVWGGGAPTQNGYFDIFEWCTVTCTDWGQGRLFWHVRKGYVMTSALILVMIRYRIYFKWLGNRENQIRDKLLLSTTVITHVVDFGGIVVGVLAIGPKPRGFRLGRGQWIFKGDKNSVTRLPSEEK
jgi:hypothetical protein